MQDFIHRTISESIEFADCEGAKTTVTVTRSRTSAGYAGISLDVGGKRVLDLTSDLEDYPSVARAIGALLAQMADEPCKLPLVE